MLFSNIIIDKLKLCYIRNNESLFWQTITKKPEKYQIGKFILIKDPDFISNQYDGVYNIHYAQYEFGKLLYNRYSDKDQKYCWLKINNEVFYSDKLTLLKDLQTEMGLKYINNITQLEIACDLPFNPIPAIKRLIKRDDVSIVRCGSKIEDKKQEIEGLLFCHPTNSLRELRPTLYFSDADNRKCLVIYDKTKEIEKSNKPYISNYYDNPKRLYRMEIRLKSDELYRYFKKNNTKPTVDLLLDHKFKKSLYNEFLFRLLHLSYKRKSISLLDAVIATKEGYDLSYFVAKRM